MSDPIVELLVATLIALNSSLVCEGAITRIGPFAGQFVESWEEFNSYRSPSAGDYFLDDPTPIFANSALISHPKLAVYEINSGAQANLGSSGAAQVANGIKGVALASTGPQLLPVYVESASITFDGLVTAFGGYWGAGTDYLYDPESIEFEFFDGNDNLIGVDDVLYSRSHLIDESQMIYWGDGQLQWTGWQFDVPIKRVVFGGGFVVADFLQVNPAPEPSLLVLLAAILLSQWRNRQLLLRRR